MLFYVMARCFACSCGSDIDVDSYVKGMGENKRGKREEGRGGAPA